MRIGRTDDMTQGGDERLWIDACPHHQVEREIVFHLRVRDVPDRTIDPVIEEILLHVFDHADHGHPWKDLARTNPPDSLAKNIFSWPSLSRELFANNNNRQGIGTIVFVD